MGFSCCPCSILREIMPIVNMIDEFFRSLEHEILFLVSQPQAMRPPQKGIWIGLNGKGVWSTRSDRELLCAGSSRYENLMSRS